MEQVLDQDMQYESPNSEEVFHNVNANGYQYRFYLNNEYEAIMKNLKEKLYPQDMKEIRLVCRGFDSAIVGLDEFRGHLKLTLREELYKSPYGVRLGVQFYQFELEKFQLHRHRTTPLFWNHAAEYLTHLTLKDSGYECDGFSTVLNSAPVLYSLTLDGVRCRDFTRLHDDSSDIPIAIPGRTRQPIRQISLKNINIMENCFLDYLRSRLGQLQEFEMVNCFSKPDDSRFVALEPFGIRFEKFLTNIVRLINQNIPSLVKMSLKNNGNQSELLRSIARTPLPLLSAIDLEFPRNEFDPRNAWRKESQYQFPAAVTFLESKKRLINLALTFNGRVSPETFKSLISPNRDIRLESLKINLPQSKPDATALLQNLSAFLRQANHLQILEVNYPVYMKTTFRVLRQNSLETTFCPSFSGEMREISLRGFIRPARMQWPPGRAETQGGFRSENLTKLEFVGPWLAPKTALLDHIIINFPNLRSLTLKKCALKDGNLLGEPDERHARQLVRAIRRLLRGVELQFGLIYEAYLRERPNQPPRRHRLLELTQLEYLDLSGNTLISDISIYPAIQFNNLKTLKLTECNRITNRALAWIGQHNPNLEIIHLENVRNHVTNVGLNNLITRCRNLKKIYTTEIIGRRTPETGTIFHPNYDDIVVKYCKRSENRTKAVEQNEGREVEETGNEEEALDEEEVDEEEDEEAEGEEVYEEEDEEVDEEEDEEAEGEEDEDGEEEEVEEDDEEEVGEEDDGEVDDYEEEDEEEDDGEIDEDEENDED